MKATATVGRVSAAHSPSGRCSDDIYQGGEHVPFAIMFPLYGCTYHANVQRGLAAAPFAIPAPGGKSALMGRFFLAGVKPSPYRSFCGRVKKRWVRFAYPPYIKREARYLVGRVSGAHPPSGGDSDDIYQGGEHVPFAIMFPLYGCTYHANVQRGLAAAPFAIPAPGGKLALMGRFFSRSKTITLPFVLWPGEKTVGALRLPTLH